MDRYAEMWYNYEKDNYGGIVMFCSKCGNKLSDGDAFCSKCGTKVNTDCQSAIHLVCQHCGSVMDYDDEQQIVACPYCGSRELVEESDDVKIERIKSKTVLAREKQANDFELEKERYAEELRQKKNREDLWAFGIIMGICVLITVVTIIYGLM